MPRKQYNVRNTRVDGSCWLYDWADDHVSGHGPKSIPVWTHDRDKALVLDGYDSALAVGRIRSVGQAAERVPTEQQ